MTKRSGLLIGAVVIAALGTFLVFLYANQARVAGIEDQQPVEVLVAKEAITVGTSGAAVVESGAVELKTFPASAVPEGAISSLDPVSKAVTSAPIYAGQILVTPMFTAEGDTTQMNLPKGTMAVALEFNDPQRVAGFVQPGAEVMAFATVDGATSVAVDKAKVVAVGPSTLTTRSEADGESDNAEEIPTAVITLALTTPQSQKLIFASEEGSLHLGLLDKDSKIEDTTSVTVANFSK